MAEQKQAEECVLYVRVSTTRQAEDGVSIEAQIGRELNTCGVPTKRGGKWSHKQVSRMLKRFNE